MRRTEWIEKEITDAENRLDELLQDPTEDTLSFRAGVQCGIKFILQKMERAYIMGEINDFEAILKEVSR